MNLKQLKKKLIFIKNNPTGQYLHSEYWRKRGKREFEKYDDYTFLCKQYKKECGRELDLRDPKRMTEKLQWLKLFWHKDEMVTTADKYLVREFVAEHGHADLLNDLIGVYDSVDDINFDSLPDQFVLKATHGSGWNFICKDKSKEDFKKWKKIIRSWMGRNLYWYGREWNYDGIKPRIIIEKYLEDDSGALMDYKVNCFCGKPLYLQVDVGRYATGHLRGFVNEAGELLDFDDGLCKNRLKEFEFNETHKRMFEIARDFCKDYPYIRVDFYLCNGRVYFGELTYFYGSGLFNFDPDKYDYIYGEELVLPEPNYNLELYAKINGGK